MATAVWSSAPADGDWTNASNWTGGSGAGGIPGNNDIVFINASSQNIDTNLVTGLTGIKLIIGPNYTGIIGGSSNHLDLDGTLDFNSGSDVYLTGTFTTVIVHGGVASDNMLQFKAAATTDIGTLRCLGGLGKITVGQNAALDDLEMFDVPYLRVLVDDNVTSLDNVTIDSGNLELWAAVVGTLESRGGTTTIEGTNTIATMNIEPRGLVKHKSSGTIATLSCYGTFDGRLNTNATVTITNTTVYEGATLHLNNGLGTYKNFTNALTYNGGSIFFAAGSLLSIAE